MRTRMMILAVGSAAILLTTGQVWGLDILDPDEVTLISQRGPTTFAVGADCDKYHGGTGGWGTNWYNDWNDNDAHDPSEPFADTADPCWGNPKSACDSSCWIASACNMLEQLGKIPSAESLYDNYAHYGVMDPNGAVRTWDEGGLQEWVIRQWKGENPGSGVSMNTHRRSTSVSWTDGMFAWEDWDPRAGTDAYLQTGWEVGIGMWPLFYDGVQGWHESGHALTIQDIYAGMTFDCTDSDRDWDWSGAGDLNAYVDATRGPTAFEGHLYYAWYNDFYDGDIGVYPVGDVGYICAIIPEPATMVLLAFGGVALLRKRRS